MVLTMLQQFRNSSTKNITMTLNKSFGWGKETAVERLPRPLLKNSFGVSIGFTPRTAPINFKDRLVGSCLERKPPSVFSKLREKEALELLLEKPLKFDKG